MAETTSPNYPAALADSTSLLGDHSNQLSLTLGATCLVGDAVITTTGAIATGAGGVNAPGYCLIDSEIIHFTGVAGATLTGCTRPSAAAGGGAAAEHASGTTVYFIPTANWANQVKDEIIAMQTELGTDPAGAFADVDTSLNTWLLGVTDGITAGSTQSQAGATALTKNINRVTVVGTNGDGVKLPTAVAGLQILIINDDSAQTIQVWPATGDAIDGGSANAVDGSQISAGRARRYIAVDATNWYTATDVVSSASTSAEGIVELATGAEVATGTDTSRAVTAAGVAGVYQYANIYLDAGAMVATDTAGAEAGTHEYVTNDVNWDYFAFDNGATEENVNWKIAMPENWDRSTIKAKFYWSTDSGSSAGDTVGWGIKATAVSDDDPIDVAWGTEQVVLDTVTSGTSGDLHVTAATPAVTVAGSPALGDMVTVEVFRDTSTDDCAEDAWLFGVMVQYKITNVVAAW